ncbi:MAG: hypothetical protein A2268_17105 [Candidatus Raymondbacteria bacterium RifOxyA12_full_50_37]|uniref:Uncharacterized protein n=1 Tax=Candidatus Raymondbacteria bacterium RIFOXYD12_FULL_49_13 TaxID=1817890 RepID=A0A1F7FD10_UNCRA|nr:MAG: hypothetical protein A2268_17105 [Candidatus Raymondbacteria bacterium RifOxyA12_full_50_37]OGJ87132.1 MAG: hypothetical protein A2248_19215 [Candidatus Raymondbacteria bacterium RIFOXYA2_FULL_49_16]OGJ96527.1 MAG: hypothetical protein A2453_03220 [Candidatus Raymondbacteria bacterium RIFOXYC2_FULL_50_21]OGK04481.1 MAG: hypothetical protein A2519_08175 [Candidatus Raymondbacteria bacterium RIFOXYD12_FULL_49_13]OGP40956.1 MAG: hypothetical protein A2324_09925 [Candidatus Raymondbacteria 
MPVKYFPDEKTVAEAKANDDPLLVLASFDGSETLAACIDDAMEHTILLKKMGYKESLIDHYFRIVLNREGADWTFACPADYKNITDRNRRIETFYNDGIDCIDLAIKALGYKVAINIPERYRRHSNTFRFLTGYENPRSG